MKINTKMMPSRWLVLGACVAASASGGCTAAEQNVAAISVLTNTPTCRNAETDKIELVNDRWDVPGGICTVEIESSSSLVSGDNEDAVVSTYTPPI